MGKSMRKIIFVVSLLASVGVFAEQVTLKTPRGAEVFVTVHAPQGNNLPALVVAPGQGCNSKNLLFETLAKEAQAQGLVVVRMEWNYCNAKPKEPMPSDQLKNEIEDLQTVMDYTYALGNIDKTKVTLVGKSLGSLVGYSIFPEAKQLKNLILLTPVCSYVEEQTGKTISVAETNYPGIKTDSRQILLALGTEDPICSVPVLYDFLKDSKGNISVVVANGDHGFRIKNAQGEIDQARTERNTNTVVNAVLNWKFLND
jgi:predicted alpha/beta-hydrolase family hydrolase